MSAIENIDWWVWALLAALAAFIILLAVMLARQRKVDKAFNDVMRASGAECRRTIEESFAKLREAEEVITKLRETR